MSKELSAALAWVGIVGAVTLGSIMAYKFNYVDHEAVERLVMGTCGLMFIWYGNRIPKLFTANARLRKLQRVAAWSSVLSYLVYLALWTFAPLAAAIWGGSAAVLAGVVVTLGYGASLRAVR